jgi:hypothetical protein
LISLFELDANSVLEIDVLEFLYERLQIATNEKNTKTTALIFDNKKKICNFLEGVLFFSSTK